jgi:four helix bundle protein
MAMQRMPFQQLDSYVAARELARRVHAAKIRDAELCDQATRAAKSAFLQLCEGLPSESAAMRRKYFNCAVGSLHEAVGAVDLAAAIGAVDETDAEAVQELGERLRRMLRALMR